MIRMRRIRTFAFFTSSITHLISITHPPHLYLCHISTPDIQSSSPFLPQYEDSLQIPTIPFLPLSTLSPKKRAVSGSPGLKDNQQNPNKRQNSDIARGTRLLFHAFKQSFGSFSMSDEHHAAAVKAAGILTNSAIFPSRMQLPVSVSHCTRLSQSNMSILICRIGRTIVSYMAD